MSKTILVIEDEQMTRTNIMNFLESEGFHPVGAENGQVGIQLAQTHLPDLIICDIIMPELDGYDVLTTLQQNAKTASIPFIFLTMTANEAGYRQSLEMGADDYLSKPIKSERLRQAIATQLQKQTNTLLPPVPTPPFPPTQSLSTDTDCQSLLTAKEQLLTHLLHHLSRRLTKSGHTIEQLKSAISDTERQLKLNDLQETFAQLLAVVNEVSILQTRLTPQNTKTLLEKYKFLDD
jgi:DNA-binding response OmpR family regulator